MKHWLGVVCRDHVRRGTERGIAFTAIGTVTDDEVWQAHEGDFHPWRRRVDYLPTAAEIPIRSLRLDLTAEPNWGYQLRRGLISLTEHDFNEIHAAMLVQASPA